MFHTGSRRTLPAFCLALLLLTLPTLAADSPDIQDAKVVIDGHEFDGWTEYFTSDYFQRAGKRCGTRPSRQVFLGGPNPVDCSFTSTNPSGTYEPTMTYQIPVVTHIIRDTAGTQGALSDARVYSQMDVLNEDFQGVAGSNGEPGYDSRFRFVPADADVSGNQTNGITLSNNTTWFNDGGSYWNTLAWDTNRFMNVYTNTAGGNLGYVPDLPQGGIAGDPLDRVVILHTTFGKPAPFVPFNLGRTGTHELGHYFGLEHTFSGGCGTATVPACYSSGDLICDTNGESSPTSGCPGSRMSCGSIAPIDNYMDYSDDSCMNKFTQEQVRRMVCSMQNFRPALYTPVEPDRLVEIDFEDGNFGFTSTTGGADLSVTPVAAIEGNQGMQALINDLDRLYGQDETVGTEDRARVRFWLDPSNLTMADNKRIRVLQLFSTNPDNYRLVTLVLRYNAGTYYLRAKTHNDPSSSGWNQIPWVTLNAGQNLIEFDWKRSSGAGSNDGYLRLWVNRRPAGEVANVDNDERTANMVRLGVVGGLDAADGVTSGSTLYFDGYETRKSLYIGYYPGRGADSP